MTTVLTRDIFTANIDVPTPVSGTDATNKSYVDSRIPPGVSMLLMGIQLPSDWLVCDGTPVSRTTYAALFAAIGTTYGAGDGSTTFTLPSARAIISTGGTTFIIKPYIIKT